ncbi:MULTISPECIES: disulfide oxidoreductase [Planococcus]|uniref:Disulfide bond formation protein B n=1 Tax=Planococcus faecalis TaxID=1598147 RepID=A0ABN4XQI3_9BACL|nr:MULTISPECIES: disulfide oxidoreductase [Planococcus]AQU79524.1 disulfide bond formation protein B [Planococcus faecalis]MDJ0332880.1 disulfide oxidoreductase [Planococcus sp. S3-L1]OHX51928.1 2-oxoglutarate dehydrogenase [Planococcus faecalis]
MENGRKQSSQNAILLYGAWFLALIATLGSLYFSEIRGFVPCELCWYQRIAVYPLILILGIATFRNDIKVFIYVLPLSLLGGIISILHYLEQKVPGFAGIKPCVSGIPCSSEYINWIGFVTIPFLAFIAFALISILMIVLMVKNK